MDGEPMESVEKGAVISVSIAGGVVIISLIGVIVYIIRELYCMDNYNALNSIRRRRTRTRRIPKATSKHRPDMTSSVHTTDANTPSPSTNPLSDRVAPGGREIPLPVPNLQTPSEVHVVVME